MRAAIYARCSSDNQRNASIEDQVRECRARLEHEGGAMNALYLKHLAQKTHRGLEGRVRQGRSGGGL